MSKLPEKFKPIMVQQVQPNEASVEIVEMLTAEQSKINEIIEYLEQYEQQKPISHDELDAILLERAKGTFSKHQQLCIRGGNFACACEGCNKKFMENLDKL